MELTRGQSSETRVPKQGSRSEWDLGVMLGVAYEMQPILSD